MKKFDLLVLFVISALCLNSCKKGIDGLSDKSKIIVGKNWKMTAYTIDGVDSYTTLYPPCERDNLHLFTADGKFKVDEGATKCDANDPQVAETGNWEIRDNKLTFSDSASSLQLQATIIELSEKTLKYSVISPEIIVGGISTGTPTLILTFTAQ